jgi:hypothetical protein
MTHSESHLSTPFEFHEKKEANCQACAGALLEMRKMGKLWVDHFIFCGVVFCNFLPCCILACKFAFKIQHSHVRGVGKSEANLKNNIILD